jgi:hypothetical protein
MSLIAIGYGLSMYSTIGIGRMFTQFFKLANVSLPYKNSVDTIEMEKVENVNFLELHKEIKSSPVYVGNQYTHFPIDNDPDSIFLGSIGKFTNNSENHSWINYQYIDTPNNKVFICDLTKTKYEKLLQDYDENTYLKNIIESNASQRLFLHEINKLEAIVLTDKHNQFGSYHESQKYLAFNYMLRTRFPFTFTSGIIGSLIYLFN